MTSALFNRLLGFSVLWLALAGASPSDLPVGMIAIAVATLTSLRLLPPAAPVSLPELLRFGLRFCRQSILAGIDVARRAFDPALPLAPGFVVYRSACPAGPGRAALTAVMSLQPGTLPVDTAPDGGMLVHCLDTREPVAAQLAADEDAFDCITTRGGHHG